MRKVLVSGFVIIGMSLSSAGLADPPPWAGGGKGKGKGHGHQNQSQQESRPDHVSRHFAENQRIVVYEYYGDEFRRGKCPPGLAKKNNGCMPPGQAKKWVVGQPLPVGVAYYPLSPALLGRLTPAPAGYLYVQVGPDVLLMGSATRMIVSAVAIF